jgi:hypothetical protein
VLSSLLRLVDAADAALDRGNTAAAIRSLEAFVALVESQSDVSIPAMHADCIAGHAEMVIAALAG